jgi:hypothetical protein
MGRPGLSSQQKHELWAQWKAGRSLSDIGRNLGRGAGSIFGVLRLKGGNRAKAELWAKKALREDPQFQEAQQFLDELS